jgi:molybdopterin molybdotransferase
MEHRLVTVQEAWEIVARSVPDWGVQPVALRRAASRILAQDILADRDCPGFDRVCMDGIAVTALPVPGQEFGSLGVQAAGEAAMELSGTESCCEVMTGGVLPSGSLCVIPYEDLERTADGFRFVPRKAGPLRLYANVSRRGEDCAAGDLLLRCGSRLGAAEVGILASVGAVRPSVRRRPRVAVVSTGSELVSPREVPGPASLRRSNDMAVTTLLRQWGVTVGGLHHLRDDPDETREVLARLLGRNDVLVTTGGVSMGRYDHVHAVLPRLGVERLFHGVAQKPGKPFWFGSTGRKLVFALPGNPVSALFSARRFVVPALSALDCAAREVRLDFHLKPDPLTRFLPLRRGEEGWVPAASNGSGDFMALAGTEGFVEWAPGADPDRLPFHRWAPGG